MVTQHNTNCYWGKLKHLHKRHIFEEKAAGLFPRPAKLFSRGKASGDKFVSSFGRNAAASALDVLTEIGAQQPNLNS